MISGTYGIVFVIQPEENLLKYLHKLLMKSVMAAQGKTVLETIELFREYEILQQFSETLTIL